MGPTSMSVKSERARSSAVTSSQGTGELAAPATSGPREPRPCEPPWDPARPPPEGLLSVPYSLRSVLPLGMALLPGASMLTCHTANATVCTCAAPMWRASQQLSALNEAVAPTQCMLSKHTAAWHI